MADARKEKSLLSKNTTHCCVRSCGNTFREGLSFHHFPSNADVRRKWEVALHLQSSASKYMRVCSEHFDPSKYMPGLDRKRRRLKQNVIPTRNRLNSTPSEEPEPPEVEPEPPRDEPEHGLNVVQESLESTSGGEEFRKLTFSREIEHGSIKEEVQDMDISISMDAYVKIEVDTTEPVVKPFTGGAVIERESVGGKGSDIKDAGTQTEKIGQIIGIIDDASKLYTYTGLHSFEILDGLTTCVSDLARDQCTVLSIKERIILTLCKIKLNMSFTVMAPLFGVSQWTCARYFKDMVPKLAAVLEVVIPFPSQEDIHLNLPVAFNNFRDTKVVIDCAETPIECSKCLKCRILTYSHYRGTHTVKFKIGVSPLGLITSVSRCYGGKASDKLITLESHLLDKLDARDAIMADTGFIIEKECLERFITQSPFLSKRKQKTSAEALRNAEIARARVRVDRVIQRIREFDFIGTKVERTLLPYFEQCLIIVCGLINFSSPVLNIDKFL